MSERVLETEEARERIRQLEHERRGLRFPDPDFTVDITADLSDLGMKMGEAAKKLNQFGAALGAPLTNVSVDFTLDAGEFVTKQVFPAVPVAGQHDKYAVYGR